MSQSNSNSTTPNLLASESVLVSRSVKKSFGDFTAVKSLDLQIKRGECFGLLGPNGAGKSTFIGLLYGTALRSGGELTVFGMDPATQSQQIKMRIGVVTQDNALDESLSVFENLNLYCGFVGVPKSQRAAKINSLLEYMNLSHKKDAKIISLSGGMKRRLVFVRALLNDPELLILDEPTTGLDPAVRHLLWGKVRELHAKGVTILLTTHYMHEAEVLCDRLVIMDQGEIKAEGSPHELIQKYGTGYVSIFSLMHKVQVQAQLEHYKNLNYEEESSGLYVRGASLDELFKFQELCGIPAMQVRPTNLEDVFLKHTGKGLSDEA
jgi:lipooligosaccharide transport system ATP-binding protein